MYVDCSSQVDSINFRLALTNSSSALSSSKHSKFMGTLPEPFREEDELDTADIKRLQSARAHNSESSSDENEESCFIVFQPIDKKNSKTHLTVFENDTEDDIRVKSETPGLVQSLVDSKLTSTDEATDKECTPARSTVRKPILPEWMIVGESVRTTPESKLGVIGFIGQTDFAPGIWVGVILDTPTGKNDGTVDGMEYFKCKPKHGIFVRPEKLKLDLKGRVLRQAPRMNGGLNF